MVRQSAQATRVDEKESCLNFTRNFLHSFWKQVVSSCVNQVRKEKITKKKENIVALLKALDTFAASQVVS